VQIIGLSLLAIVAIIAFFGFGKRFFARLGLKEWILFLFILALVVGVLVPPIVASEYAYISVGAFLVPLLFSVILLYSSSANKSLANFTITLLLVAAMTLAIFTLMRNQNIVLIALATGFASGVVAFLVSKKRSVALIGSISGIVIGDVLFNIINTFIFDGSIFLGGRATFNSFIIAPFVALLLFEIVATVKAKQKQKNGLILLSSFEVAEDIDLTKKLKPEDDIMDLLK